jgi:hypothetical protein
VRRAWDWLGPGDIESQAGGRSSTGSSRRPAESVNPGSMFNGSDCGLNGLGSKVTWTVCEATSSEAPGEIVRQQPIACDQRRQAGPVGDWSLTVPVGLVPGELKSAGDFAQPQGIGRSGRWWGLTALGWLQGSHGSGLGMFSASGPGCGAGHGCGARSAVCCPGRR